MNTKLEDFSEEEIRHRIQEESSFCDLKGYSRKDLVPGVTKVSFQVTYNTTGHVLFGIATLGIASLIVENSKVHHIFFDNASGNCIGQTINEAESYFNDQCEISINNYDFSSAENYSKIKCSLGRSNESKFIYEYLSDKIRGNFSINEGLLRLNQPGSLVESYKLIKKGYDSLENCNDKSIQEAQQILNIVQAQIDDELSKDEIELINIPDFREETEEICLELESLIQLLGSREPYRTGI
ncbi:uncharacterized protein LOC123305305 [Chrysoperla carnea]|uniref:uncharacterized protein LOC123305305 n=1 Tax=Chrysoperla carnea TaxID=189513 RepID=UPI001D07768B|nr:uncharacterized protein LOC123305305 [Chrysoperla carnea]